VGNKDETPRKKQVSTVGYLGTPELWKENPVSDSDCRSKVFPRLSPIKRKVNISVLNCIVLSNVADYYISSRGLRLFTREVINISALNCIVLSHVADYYI
jgi:hypothetical protein